MVDYSIRRLVVEDAVQTAAAEAICFEDPWSYHEIEHELSENEHAIYWGVFEGNRLCGYVGLWLVMDECHITNLAVVPEERRKGHGRRLMEEVLAWSKSHEYIGITLEVRASNYAAQALYESLGFKREGVRKRYYRNNREDALILWLRLRTSIE